MLGFKNVANLQPYKHEYTASRNNGRLARILWSIASHSLSAGSGRLSAVVRVNWHFLVISSECWFFIGKSHSWQAQSRYLTFPMT